MGRIQRSFDSYADPILGRQDYNRIASQSLGAGINDFAGMAKMRGGSFAQGQEAFRDAQASANTSAFNAFADAKLSDFSARAGFQNQTLGMMQQQSQFGIAGYQNALQTRNERRTSFINSALMIPSSIIGSKLGGR